MPVVVLLERRRKDNFVVERGIVESWGRDFADIVVGEVEIEHEGTVFVSED